MGPQLEKVGKYRSSGLSGNCNSFFFFFLVIFARPLIWDSGCCLVETHLEVTDSEALRRICCVLCPRLPWAHLVSTGNQTDLTLVQVSWPSCGRWNEIVLQLLSQQRTKINGLCISWKQWKAFSGQKKKLSPSPICLCPPDSQTSQPGLCGHSWTRVTVHVSGSGRYTKTNRLCDPSPFSHTQIYWIGRVFLLSYWYSSRWCCWEQTSDTLSVFVWQQLVRPKWDSGNELLMVCERTRAWFWLNHEEEKLFVSCPQSTQYIWRCQIPACRRRVMIYSENFMFIVAAALIWSFLSACQKNTTNYSYLQTTWWRPGCRSRLTCFTDLALISKCSPCKRSSFRVSAATEENRNGIKPNRFNNMWATFVKMEIEQEHGGLFCCCCSVAVFHIYKMLQCSQLTFYFCFLPLHICRTCIWACFIT